MKKLIFIMLAAFIAIKLKSAESNEPKIVKIEIIGRPRWMYDGAIVSSKNGLLGLRAFPTFRGAF